MSGASVMHTELLTEPQKRILPPLAEALVGTDYYLAGGTALTLRIGHRPSVDFDWFTPQLGDPEGLLRRLNAFHIAFTVLSVSVETVYLSIEAVQVSFIGYAYPLLQSTVLWPQIGLQLAGTDDIACMKLSAVASRGARKDFIDLHCLITRFRSLEEYLGLYRKKYQQRDLGHVIRSLVYFADAEVEPEIETNPPLAWETLKRDIETWVVRLRL